MARTTSKECCKIDAIVTVDAKGQIVLPKDLRQKANISQNDKLAVIGMQKQGAFCCIVLMKTDALGNSLKQMLAPIFDEALGQAGESR